MRVDIGIKSPALVAMASAGQRLADAAMNPCGRSAIDIYGDAIAELSRVVLDDSERMPVDLFQAAVLPDFNASWLPSALSDYAIDQAELIGCSAVNIAMSALTACCAALDDAIQIQPTRHPTGWLESARIWTMIVGESGQKKSPGMQCARRPIARIDADLHANSLPEIAAYNDAHDAHRAAVKLWLKDKKGAQPAPPPRPLHRRAFMNEATIAALADVLCDNPRGLLVYREEMAGWLGSMDAFNRGSGMERAAWIEAYDGGLRVIDRSMRGAGSVRVENWGVSFLGATQPGKIRSTAERMSDDGLLQRFIPIVVDGARPAVDRIPDRRAMDDYASIVRGLFEMRPGDGPVTMTEEAISLKETFLAEVSEWQKLMSLPAMMRSHLGKWPGLFARLCLVFHAIECAHGGLSAVQAKVGGDVAQRVGRFMRECLFPHAEIFHAEILGGLDPVQDSIRWIAGWILSTGAESVKNRDITQLHRPWRTMPEWMRTRVAQALVDYGWILSCKGSSWPVNPATHALFSAQAARELHARTVTGKMLASLRARKR